MNEKKLKERCVILREMIIRISGLYNNKDTNDGQKNLIETTIGAALWYLPNGNDLYTGKISQEAIGLLIKEKGNLNKLTKEHKFPRKMAGKELLTNKLSHIKSSSNVLVKLYKSKYGKFNYVTPAENKRLVKYKTYKKAGINLISKTMDELKNLKKVS